MRILFSCNRPIHTRIKTYPPNPRYFRLNVRILLSQQVAMEIWISK